MAVVDSVKLPDNSSHDIADNYSGYQKQTLTTPLTIKDTQESTVEGALGGLNNYGDALSDNLVANEESGAKNLAILDLGAIMPINTGGTWSGNVYSHRSVNFTVTDNGVSVSGTASGGAAFIDIPLSTLTNGKEYIANGISGGADETYQIKFLNSSLVVQSVADLYEGERTFEKNSTNQNVEIYRIRVASGATVATEIYPMIRDARVIDPTFAPFAKTNLQLTNDKAERKDLTTIFATGTTNTTGAQIKAGAFFYLNGVYCKAKTNIAAGAAFAFNTNYKYATVGEELFNRQIIEDSVTANTGTYGNVNLGINASAYVLIDAYTTTANYTVIPIISGGNWYAHVVLYTDYSTLSNADVTIYFRYIKL